MVVANNLPGRADADLKLFFLQRFEKADFPIPDVQFRRHQAVGFAQAELALQIDLGILVHIKNDRRLVSADVFTEARNKCPRARKGLFPRHLKVDRSFWKRLKEVFMREEQPDDPCCHPQEQRALFRTGQAITGHSGLH